MLKPYMVFSNACGPSEGAGLVFAHTVKEARKVGWQAHAGDFTDEYIDFAANLMKAPWLYDEVNAIKYANDEAHVIYDMKYCSVCERWGGSPIGADGVCEGCRLEAGSTLRAPDAATLSLAGDLPAAK